MKFQIAEFSEGKRRKIKRGLGRRSEVRTVLWLCSPPSNKFLNCRAASFRLESTAIVAKQVFRYDNNPSWRRELHVESLHKHREACTRISKSVKEILRYCYSFNYEY
jgi:hypothetical protein